MRIELHHSTYLALRRAARSVGKTEGDSARDAIVKALREAEYEQIRLSYEKQPDSEAEADDWNTVEEFQPDRA